MNTKELTFNKIAISITRQERFAQRARIIFLYSLSTLELVMKIFRSAPRYLFAGKLNWKRVYLFILI